MDQYLEQNFQINSLKIGAIRYAGVLKIGTAGAVSRKVSNAHHPTGYITLESAPTLLTPAVPLEAPVRKSQRDGSSGNKSIAPQFSTSEKN